MRLLHLPTGVHSSLVNDVILCTDEGTPLGTLDRTQAHALPGKLHRAFSVFLFTREGDALLLQKRSARKALFPGVWANTCCSHLRLHEEVIAAGEARLQEEMGIATLLKRGPSFVYRAEDPGRGVEFEYDTILLGIIDRSVPVACDPEEVAEWKWMTMTDLRADMKRDPKAFAPWFHLGLALIRFEGEKRIPHPEHG